MIRRAMPYALTFASVLGVLVAGDVWQQRKAATPAPKLETVATPTSDGLVTFKQWKRATFPEHARKLPLLAGESSGWRSPRWRDMPHTSRGNVSGRDLSRVMAAQMLADSAERVAQIRADNAHRIAQQRALSGNAGTQRTRSRNRGS